MTDQAAPVRVRVLVPSNPKRPGSKSYERFALIRDGMPMREYLALGAWARAELRHSLRKQHLALEAATSSS